MLKFSKIGITLREKQLSTGYLVSETWVWPWKRSRVSQGHRYRTDITSGNGWSTFRVAHFSGIGFNVSVSEYSFAYAPQPVLSTPTLSVVGFELDRLLEQFLMTHLPEGEYLIYIPRGPKERKGFWDKVDLMGGTCLGRDGYVVSVEESTSIGIAVKSAPIYPGRYFSAYSDGKRVVVGEVNL